MSDRICSVPECERPHYANGHCKLHYERVKRTGTTEPRRKMTMEERFWPKVLKTEGCWEWQGVRNHLGYGHVHDLDRVKRMAHRVSLELAGVEIPEGYDVDHLCRNPPCVRPDHLEPVTHAENMARAPWGAPDFQRAKTHCPAGHEYNAENTHVGPGKRGTVQRICRACKRKTDARKRARRAA